jgi:hypothetical protein
MDHSCEYLCSELVTVMYEDQPGKLSQITVNLEEISNSSVTVLMDEKPRLGSPISLTVKGRDLFGLITSRLRYTTIGWFATLTLDPDSVWRPDWFSPKHLLGVCLHCAKEAVPGKVKTLEMPQVTEENRLASFLVGDRNKYLPNAVVA